MPDPELPSRMRAAFYREKGRLEVAEEPVPEPGPEEVLVKVSHCGVCGTDLHLVMEGWGRPDSIGGHEWSGHVVAVGSQVSDWAPGDGAVGGPRPACGRCAACRAQRPSLCSDYEPPGVGGFRGAFAEYKLTHASQLLRLPGGLGPRVAALAEPLAVALHGITLSGIAGGQRAIVTGCGPIGSLTVAALAAHGVDDILVSEPHPARRELATKLGARAVEPEAIAPPRMPFEIVSDPCDAAFECSGNPAAFEAALGRLRKLGRLVIVGTGMKRPRLDANRVLLNELIVTGAYNYDENGMEDALALLASGRLPTDLLIEAEDVSLGDLQAAMEGLVAGRLAGKVMVAPWRE